MKAGRSRRPSQTEKLLDLLVLRFPDSDRDTLYRHVMCSEVLVDGAPRRDPQERVPTESRIEITARRFVSRAGEKLDAALTAWQIDVNDTVWLDAGASTGGFTDALLQRGAALVHAVDVGYNQLDYRLRVDPRVRVRERTNILEVKSLDPPPFAAVCDLSFRSLRGVLRHILMLTDGRWGIALLKPQFEVAAEIKWGDRPETALVDGIPDDDVREDVIATTVAALRTGGVETVKTLDSPVAGRKGNREVLIHVRVLD